MRPVTASQMTVFTKTSKRQGAKVQWPTIDPAFIRQIYPGEDCKAIKLAG
jgi:hypothetical protein